MAIESLQESTDTKGFTLVELMAALALGFVVVMAAYSVMDSQSRLFSAGRERMDTRVSVSSAAALLSWELMNLAASDGDIYALGPDSLSLRSVVGAGIVCSRATVGSAQRFGLQQVSGFFEATADDSVLVFSPDDNTWNSVKVTGAWSGSAAWTTGGTPVCFWGDSTVSVPRPQVALELTGDSTALAFIQNGVPVRIYRRTQYALFLQDGRSWLGRRIGAASTFDVLTGPMWLPADSGLVFRYYDAAGAATTNPNQVARVDLELRAESFGKVRRFGSLPSVLDDSVTTTVFLRNNAVP